MYWLLSTKQYGCILNLFNLSKTGDLVHIPTALNIEKFLILSTECIYGFQIIHRIKRDYFPSSFMAQQIK
jgi:hypothetical protein